MMWEVRDNMLRWSAGHSDAAHSDPWLLGTVTFLPDNKLGLEAISAIDPSIVNENAEAWYSNPNPTGIGSEPVSMESFILLSNYPNLFNPETKIQYQITRTETITLAIYNVNGELIRHLSSDNFHVPGSYEVLWNGRNDFGEAVSSGIYFYKLMTPSLVVVNKMMLIK